MKRTINEAICLTTMLIVSFVTIWLLTGCATMPMRTQTRMMLDFYAVGREDGRQEVKDLVDKLLDEQIKEQKLEDSSEKEPMLKKAVPPKDYN